MKQCPRCKSGKLIDDYTDGLYCISCGYRDGDSFDEGQVSDGYYDILGKILHGPKYQRETFAKGGENEEYREL